MNSENLEQFRSLVLQTNSLQEKLRDISDREEFIEQVVKEGKENGFEFTTEDVSTAMQEQQRAWIERWI